MFDIHTFNFNRIAWIKALYYLKPKYSYTILLLDCTIERYEYEAYIWKWFIEWCPLWTLRGSPLQIECRADMRWTDSTRQWINILWSIIRYKYQPRLGATTAIISSALVSEYKVSQKLRLLSYHKTFSNNVIIVNFNVFFKRYYKLLAADKFFVSNFVYKFGCS